MKLRPTLRWGLAIGSVIAIVTVALQPWRWAEPSEEAAAPAALVNGTAISMRAIAAMAADAGTFDRFKDVLVEQAIGDALIAQEAARRKIALSDAEERELDGQMPPPTVLVDQARRLALALPELATYRRAQLRGHVLLRKLLDAEYPGELVPSEAALREAFDAAPLAYAERP